VIFAAAMSIKPRLGKNKKYRLYKTEYNKKEYLFTSTL
jgi:hypothetical protein